MQTCDLNTSRYQSLSKLSNFGIEKGRLYSWSHLSASLGGVIIAEYSYTTAELIKIFIIISCKTYYIPYILEQKPPASVGANWLELGSFSVYRRPGFYSRKYGILLAVHVIKYQPHRKLRRAMIKSYCIQAPWLFHVSHNYRMAQKSSFTSFDCSHRYEAPAVLCDSCHWLKK